MPLTYNKNARSYNKKAHPPIFWGLDPRFNTFAGG